MIKTTLLNPNIEDPVEAAFWAGVEYGMRRYAHWKDGCEYVGTCGTSLMTVLREMDAENDVVCWHPGYHTDDGVEYCRRCGSVRDYAQRPRE